MKLFSQLLVVVLATGTVKGADTAPPVLSATELAGRLRTLQQDGTSFVKLRIEVQQPSGVKKAALQLQIKQRRTSTSTEVVYQVLWPKERLGEAVLLRRKGNQPASGSVFIPPDTLRPISAGHMSDPLFGSDLTYADVVENFFDWENQKIVGTEVVDRVNCQILESKPGKGQHSIYASVRSFIDMRRFVPLRVDQYLPSGELIRRVVTTRVASDDMDRHVTANLKINNPQKNSVTELEGSRLLHGVSYEERDFTPEGLKDLAPPHSGKK